MSNSTTQSVDLQNGALAFEGAVSVERTDAGVQPWRLPVAERDLFPQEQIGLPQLVHQTSRPSGVRLTFRSDTNAVTLRVAPPGVEPDPKAGTDQPWVFDLLVDGELHQRVSPEVDAEAIAFTDLPAGDHLLELYLPSQYVPIVVRELRIDAGASVGAWPDERPRIVFYGSSITQCRHAAGPSETWPALVAQRFDLHHTNLGVGGQCHMDPMMGRMIRDLPADYICLKLALCMVDGSVTDRTFRSLAIGLLKTIRDGHPDTPMAVVSPICCPAVETENHNGMTLVRMREILVEVYDLLGAHGDSNLHYVDGLSLLDAGDTHLLGKDGAHPTAEGYRFLAKAYGDKVMPLLGLSG